jgi:hypothetical protein
MTLQEALSNEVYTLTRVHISVRSRTGDSIDFTSLLCSSYVHPRVLHR